MRFVVVLLAIIFFSTPSMATDNIAKNDHHIIAPLPNCDDEKLHSLIQKKISEYFKKSPATSPLERRTQILMSRFMNNFENVDVASFSAETNRQVAHKLLNAKINNGLQDNEIRLCRTLTHSNLPTVYLLIYPENYYNMVEIINFSSTLPQQEFFVIYD